MKTNRLCCLWFMVTLSEKLAIKMRGSRLPAQLQRTLRVIRKIEALCCDKVHPPSPTTVPASSRPHFPVIGSVSAECLQQQYPKNFDSPGKLLMHKLCFPLYIWISLRTPSAARASNKSPLLSIFWGRTREKFPSSCRNALQAINKATWALRRVEVKTQGHW